MIRFKVELRTITGLLISAGRTMGRIGGADIETMAIEKAYECKNVPTRKRASVRVPYIPGSSVKGRMRSLLEITLGLKLYSSDKKIWSHTLAREVYKDLTGENKISDKEFVEELINTDLDRLYGYGAFPLNNIYKEQGNDQLMTTLLAVLTPTSILFEDLFPNEEYVCNIFKENNVITFDDFIEDKNENRIDRITSAADPRTITRVKPGVPFNGTFSLLVFDKNSSKLGDNLRLLTTGMSLLEKTYLGAGGSRGYGRVKFTEIDVGIYDPRTATETSYKQVRSVEELSKEIENLVKAIGVNA
jgi:CRISPR-associated protein Csm3